MGGEVVSSAVGSSAPSVACLCVPCVQVGLSVKALMEHFQTAESKHRQASAQFPGLGEDEEGQGPLPGSMQHAQTALSAGHGHSSGTLWRRRTPSTTRRCIRRPARQCQLNAMRGFDMRGRGGGKQ